MSQHNQEMKEKIRRNIIPLGILLILISITTAQIIIVKPSQEKDITRVALTNQCMNFCEEKGLIFSYIDEAGIGYTSKIEGRCICLNKTIINNQTK